MDIKLQLNFITIVLILLLVGYSPGVKGFEADVQPAATTTVILIRHAERDNFFTLTAQGRKRAKALIDAVGDMAVSAIYSPNLERNLDTVTPLANHLGITISLTPRFNEQTIDQIVGKILERHTGEVVLLVGNGSGNLRSLHQRLGGEGDGPYQYGDLFIYKIPKKGPVQIVKSRF